MKGKKILIIVLIVFAVIMVCASVFYNLLSDKRSGNSVESGQYSAAADFTVYDRSGSQISLSDMRGTPVVLNFWASWCGPCQSEMPVFESMYSEYGDEVHFMMVNLTGGNETADSAEKFIESKGYSFPVYFDSNGQAALAYSVYSIPETYFIDADGNIKGNIKGTLDENSLREGIDMIYKEQ